MGIIKRVGQVITDIGERTDRASASTISGIGSRNRSHTIRRKIDTLRVPKVNVVADTGKLSVRADEPEPIIIPTSVSSITEEDSESKPEPRRADRPAQPEFEGLLDYYNGKKAKEQSRNVDYLNDELQFLNG